MNRHQGTPSVSLLISTYNNHAALEKCLWALEEQQHPPDEILLADDGSGAETLKFIEAYTSRSSLPIKHLWQEDDGFRKAKIMNRAIQEANGDYLILIDADIITPKDFIRQHLQLARPKRFLTGGNQIQVPHWLQHLINRDDIINETLFTRRWYSQHKVPHSRLWRLRVPVGWPSRVLDELMPRPNSLIGCNASCWKQDALAIGGFDESFTTYGYEDRDFARRLANSGIRGKRYQCSLRYVHWEHPHPYADDVMILENKKRIEAKRTESARA